MRFMWNIITKHRNDTASKTGCFAFFTYALPKYFSITDPDCWKAWSSNFFPGLSSFGKLVSGIESFFATCSSCHTLTAFMCANCLPISRPPRLLSVAFSALSGICSITQIVRWLWIRHVLMSWFSMLVMSKVIDFEMYSKSSVNRELFVVGFLPPIYVFTSCDLLNNVQNLCREWCRYPSLPAPQRMSNALVLIP